MRVSDKYWSVKHTRITFLEWLTLQLIKRRPDYVMNTYWGVLRDDGIFHPEPDCYTAIGFILTRDHNEEGSQRIIRGLKKTSDSYYRNQAFYISSDFLTAIQHPFFIMPFRGFSSSAKLDVYLHKDDAMILKLIS